MHLQNAGDCDRCLYDWKIDVSASPGDVQLLKIEFITDETGVTTGNMRETLIDNKWIRKEFLLDAVEAETARLLIHINRYGKCQVVKYKSTRCLARFLNGMPVMAIWCQLPGCCVWD